MLCDNDLLCGGNRGQQVCLALNVDF
jgi:hypothetical protein